MLNIKNLSGREESVVKEIQKLLVYIDANDLYSFFRNLGVGFTPLKHLPKTVNPFDNRVSIYIKLEYLNFGESIKSRPFAAIYYIKEKTGALNGKNRVVAATSGNFGLAGSYILPKNLVFSALMSKKTVNENKTLIKKMVRNGTKIEKFSDSYCPALGAKRGQAIAFARKLEETSRDLINIDQYSDTGNPLSHFLTTGPEIYFQTNGRITHFVAGLGTCGTVLGAGLFLKKVCGEAVKIIGLVPQEGHHQLGLRSRDELGATRFFSEARNLCEEVIEVSDCDSFTTMMKLWEIGVPGGISSGTNCYGALKLAEKIYSEGDKGLIVTVAPDSLENYEEFLRIHIPHITGKKFNSGIHEKIMELKIEVEREREKHISKIRSNKIKLTEMLNQINKLKVTLESGKQIN